MRYIYRWLRILKLEEANEKRLNKIGSLGSIASKFASPILGKKGFVETDIITKWESIVGETLAEKVVPVRIAFSRGKKDNGTLHVEVEAGGVALELQHKEKYIIEKINSFFGYSAIAKISMKQCQFIKKTPKISKTSPKKVDVNIDESILPEDENLRATMEKLIRNFS